jgi:ribosomal protein L36
MKIKGPVLFASDDSEEAVEDAKTYISRFRLTHDDVQLVKRERQTLVIAKRNISHRLCDK